MTFSSPFEAAHDLLRHVEPKRVEDRLHQVYRINGSLVDELCSTVDVPLQIAVDPETQQQYIRCDFNRDCDSFRSPFTSRYYPELPDGIQPPPALRRLELAAQGGFDAYKRLYFSDGAVLSVYAWEIDYDRFGVGVFVRKDVDSQLRDGSSIEGAISCSDVVEVIHDKDCLYKYDMVSTILLDCRVGTALNAPIEMSGGIADHMQYYGKALNEVQHLINVGQMIEENASTFMEKVKKIYVGKMEEVFGYSKSSQEKAEVERRKKMLAKELLEKFKNN